MSVASTQARLTLGPDDEDPAAARRFADRLRAVRLAAKCFEIARSTRHDGERANAISRGIAIAEKAGLRIDLFDIPGRDRQHLHDALRDAGHTLRRWAETLRAGSDETIYDAKRRAFDAATSAAAERDRANGRRAGRGADPSDLRRADLLDRWPSIGAAINALRARRVEVIECPCADGPPRWEAASHRNDRLDEWQLRELADEVCA